MSEGDWFILGGSFGVITIALLIISYVLHMIDVWDKKIKLMDKIDNKK